jgi:hypothetical protein
MISKYGLAYRLGVTPWERYATDAATSVGMKLDREEAQRVGALGRALDLGCGRGLYTTSWHAGGGSPWGWTPSITLLIPLVAQTAALASSSAT